MCPICRNFDNSVIGSPKINFKAKDLIRHEYEIKKCNCCRTYYVDPPIDLSIDEWKTLYNQDYFPEMSTWYEKNREMDRKVRFDKLEYFSNRQVVNFLDVGCGEGHCLIEAEKRGWKPHGVDIFDHRITMAKKNTIEFKSSSLTESNYPDNYFDIIYMDSVLEHVINPLDYLIEIRRILKGGGLLYIGVPNEDSLLNAVKRNIYRIKGGKLSPILKPFETPYHIVGFNYKSLIFLFKKVQLEIKQIRNFACRLEFLKAKPFSKTFFHSLLLLPIYLLAVPFRKEVYIEIYAQKN